MSNLKNIDNILKLATLVGRLKELEETKLYLGGTGYYAARRRSLKEAIEREAKKLLGIEVAPRKKVVVFEVEGERPDAFRFDEGVTVSKALVTKTVEQEPELNNVAAVISALLGKKVAPDAKNLQQELVTTIEGWMQL